MFFTKRGTTKLAIFGRVRAFSVLRIRLHDMKPPRKFMPAIQGPERECLKVAFEWAAFFDTLGDCVLPDIVAALGSLWLGLSALIF
ncbi:hypothetical protein QIH85_43055 [Bradyrhizobium japonicum]|uniref:hypothetical protein n=1 Tax=Bradyrhizobium japonicum TaxID=375 RepID=UPI001E2CD29B|nr:hypothetical protein [Bradyrhizobium japonicum]MCD9898143.1 hypothetical protein [Bradyrhizobium japonicum]WLB28512.1 hypothetical protein QIH85_43055 [Bradyrhizobium japonicum]WRJ84734.1 hypothetical protein R3F78_07600 [Bradyrhizobium japonicum]WRJ93704.1 hypothetical protein R3F77_05310 [Bradyrhizobium japonicum]WRK47556.1 hypothetical protein R3F73_05370 [Bradyrhizobium japonicum]